MLGEIRMATGSESESTTTVTSASDREQVTSTKREHLVESGSVTAERECVADNETIRRLR